MAKTPTNIAASVRQRLLNFARSEGRDFQTLLVAFGLERLIFRLSKSPHRDKFVLKGGMLVTLWTTDSGRFTRDIDFLAFGETEDATLTSIFAEILSFDAGDGLEFSIDTITTTDIREDQVYGGKRLRTVAHLNKTEIPITIDLGFGDALPDPHYEIEYGSILDFEPARIRAYSPATVIAEKFQAVVALGLINGRMKDFYDLWAIPKATEIDQADLRAAIAATFERRNTPVPTEAPPGLSAAFAEDPAKARQWLTYADGTELKGVPLSTVVADIWTYLKAALDTN
ncbi:MAG: nucleotidyl transferase AbiEii/AbiGii toxin family protein [Alphaproteobacteria bacterium]|nr:nucleotidyl transferase AbiEii/AbiGii toxin family protein [Alphaproteobacteria bacterium]MBU2083069.1 nucleotidyl transferase AbiEii/AbiGii toxin family protein [Alphaproteobacteria bacterium]MBU2144632.1 nucleotidyl transferase AbiEii/AbiGii toxin family protein [Alphaproteobacteria bacterium]MBU2195353.1 nucleotidyl transferase AbiEii/AbiGii toxin family protein [Alphaproteobacteria bacterium]